MEKQHYIYRMFNELTGEYYIGQRTCNGTAWLDGKYKGSGKVIRRKVKAHPEEWKKEILCFAASREMLNELEILYIGDAWRDDPKCLNLTPGGEGVAAEVMRAYYGCEENRIAHATRLREVCGTEEARAAQSARTKKRFESEEARAAHAVIMREVCGTEEARAAQSARTKKRYESEEERAAQSIRAKKQLASAEAREAHAARLREIYARKEVREAHSEKMKQALKVKLISPEGDPVAISRNLVLDYLLRGYTFAKDIISIQNDALRQWTQYNGKKAVALLLADKGWVYGYNITYTRVSPKQVEESLK